MKFSVQLVLAVLATAVSATPLIVQRDFNSISKVISDVQTKLDAVAASVSKDDTEGTLSSGKALISACQAGTSEVKKSQELALSDTAKLLGPVGTLKQHGQKLHDDFISKRGKIEGRKMCGKAREMLGQFSSSAHELIEAIISKVPQASRGIASSTAKEITDLIDDIKANFGPDKCKGA
ncbi:hypothetical protein L249_8715 [Ophiocordyceps polyrhachis-furcata BCC 54312]|uniref:Cell wall protein n=1 Tax=Ophiocordyceps polyrhachis-furcata BCC 54312 TaxID=1330021 RepID=A0A367L6J8_9HYPO|nr:hypothetical protein L249_8715 [Ophiocordyceps polyrhachis-furcata BCC 54312]